MNADRYEALERRISLLEAREPWLDYKALAAHFSTSVRTVQMWKAEGMPMRMLDGKCKGQLSEILPWLETHGHAGYVSNRVGSRLVQPIGAAPAQTDPPPDTRSDPHVS